MIEVNLLPKDYLKRSSGLALGKSGRYVVIAAAAVILAMAGTTIYQMRQLDDLQAKIERGNERAAMLQKDIRLVDALTDIKGKITLRMEAVEKLDRHRSVWVRILQDVAANVPEFVWMAGFTQKKVTAAPAAAPNKTGMPNPNSQPAPADTMKVETLPAVQPVEIEGYAFTLNSLAAFMISLMRSNYFDGVELVKSEETIFEDDEKAYNFVIAANVHYLSEEELSSLIAETQEEDQLAADFESAEPLPEDMEPAADNPTNHKAQN